MDSVWQEIGINTQHICETTVPGRYQLICDRSWLQTLERQRKLTQFNSWPQLDRRDPARPLEHPWIRVLVQTYRKQPQRKVYPLPSASANASATTTTAGYDGNTVNGTESDVDYAALPLSYSQAVAYVANTNFKSLWESAYKRYAGAHVKFCRQTQAANTAAGNLLNSPTDAGFLSYDVALKELIQRIYRCPIVHSKADRCRAAAAAAEELHQNGPVENTSTATIECNTNILPALVAIETSTYFVIVHYPPPIEYNLYDCITYSSAVLGKSYNKSLFIIYQLFQLSKALQTQGLFLGDLRLQHIMLRDNLWLQIMPRLECNMFCTNVDDIDIGTPILEDDDDDAAAATAGTDLLQGCGAVGIANECIQSIGTKFDLKFAYDLHQFTLREYTELWCNGQLSNFDYLTILNNASGRSLHNPAYYHIMPWVSDFAARNGANWRDLTKSKYRLNKGDVHLDLMYTEALQHTQTFDVPQAGAASQLAAEQVPHHVSEFLSEITYFVYMARRTPQSILCAHVRPIWVPAEYPVSIQRLQEWTPDECIPEFYTDPMIFKSIHEDLPDLELPTWASCPEDFICKHREALESQYVSERLHHWIDLNFGYKLSGKAAIKSKNVCLSLVDQHRDLCQRGIVQLFTQPHPPKRFPSAWFNKTAPRLSQLYNSHNYQRSTTNGRSPKIRPKLHANEASKRLAKSTENLHTSSNSNSESVSSSPRMSLHPLTSSAVTTLTDDKQSSANFYPITNFIELPKDYNPAALLQSFETMQSFFARTFPKQKAATNTEEKMITSDLMFDDNSEEHSFTNQLFADELTKGGVLKSPRKCKNFLVTRKLSLKHKLSEKREQELQVMGCLIVEIFMLQRLRPLLNGNGLKANFEARLQACRIVVEQYKHELPKCLRYIVRVLLQLKSEHKEQLGLPPLNATQILEPIFATSLIPFPSHYYAIFGLVRAMHAFDFNSTLLELHTHFNCNGKECAKYTDIDRKRVLFERKIAECKVMSCCAHIRSLLEPQAYEQFSPVELLLPHIIDLLSDERTSILTAWNLFDPVAQALGIAQTQQYLLLPIMKLYDVECFERGMISVRNPRTLDANGSNVAGHVRFSTSSSFKSRKSVKLYHHSFLLRLIVRFGLRCFLQHFIAPLIEAVGGYKEPEDGNGFHYHSGVTAGSRRTSKNLSLAAVDVQNTTPNLVTTNSREDFEDEVTTQPKQEIEDVFSFEDDPCSDHISNSGTAENKSIDSFDMRGTATAEEAKEDYEQAENTTEKLAISEIFYGSKISNTSFEDADRLSLKSQGAQDSPQATIAPIIGPKSPTIEIPSSVFRRSYQLNTIDCEIGSRKSVDSFEIIQQAVEEAAQQQKQRNDEVNNTTAVISDKIATTTSTKSQTSTTSNTTDACDSLQASVISKMSEAKALQNNRISEMSAESLVWLSHRLGPVLTSRYITRNLLKMLTLCYVGQENLLPEIEVAPEEATNLNYFSIADARVVGDRSAARVLECLMSIAALFGEEMVLLHYFPHIIELIALSSKRITSSLEGAIISSLQLLKYMVPCLKDVTIMEHLKDIILDAILLPLLRILGSTRLHMPSGYLGRSLLARKLLDATYALSVRIGPDMSKDHLCQPLLRPFFLLFDKAYSVAEHLTDSIIALTITPPQDMPQQPRATEELRDVFNAALAHSAYLTFLRFLGESIMQRTIANWELVLTLCHEFEQPNYKPQTAVQTNIAAQEKDSVDGAIATPDVSPVTTDELAHSFGTQVIGNRIAVATSVTTASNATTLSKQEILGPMEVLDMVAHKFQQFPTTRHLKGNWLAYWRHEITNSDKDTVLNLKQIRLQAFNGHTNSVRSIIALDNENSFISASKDKTVKLWSLRSEGDGKKSTACQFTYTAHKKSIHSLSFLDSMRYVVSCDSGVHIWDPFIGRPLGILDSPRHNPVTVVKCLPSPSPLIVCGTAESTVKIIDARTMQYVNEWRVSAAMQANATVRCVTVAPSGNWLAVGLSTGGIVMLDTRTGIVLNAWRPIECDILQLAAINDQQLISSALDHSLAVWHAQDGILHYQLKPPAEPAHFLQTIDRELIYATTGNRIGVYADINSSHAAHSVTKLRSETFRGVLTSVAVLPLNHSILAGNESGNIVLLC